MTVSEFGSKTNAIFTKVGDMELSHAILLYFGIISVVCYFIYLHKSSEGLE
jgi:hypothetical protein